MELLLHPQIPGWCGLYPGLTKQLRVFTFWVLEDMYGFVPHLSVAVCQHLCLVVQNSLVVGFEAEPSQDRANLFFILCVVVIVFGT